VAAPAFDPDAYTADSKNNWSKAAPHYGKLADDLFRPMAHAFVKFAGVKAGQTVLDVACGPGTATLAAAHAVGPHGKVVGVDLAPGMLKAAGERLGTIDLREMNAEALDLPDATFDAVICQLGLMLFAKPALAVSEMARVCKPGGVVACLVQGQAEKMCFTSLVMKTMVRHAPQLKVPGAPMIYAFGDPGVLDAALTKAGLTGVASHRMEGTFTFSSPEEYWKRMTEGAGRTGAMLRELPAKTQEAVRADVVKEASAYRRGGKVEMPFEVVMARGLKSR
jgi:ubiquinone/menaquinone biosynthesis C-methylase UbiE